MNEEYKPNELLKLDHCFFMFFKGDYLLLIIFNLKLSFFSSEMPNYRWIYPPIELIFLSRQRYWYEKFRGTNNGKINIEKNIKEMLEWHPNKQFYFIVIVVQWFLYLMVFCPTSKFIYILGKYHLNLKLLRFVLSLFLSFFDYFLIWIIESLNCGVYLCV